MYSLLLCESSYLLLLASWRGRFSLTNLTQDGGFIWECHWHWPTVPEQSLFFLLLLKILERAQGPRQNKIMFYVHLCYIEWSLPVPKGPNTNRLNWVRCLHIVSDVAWLCRLLLYHFCIICNRQFSSLTFSASTSCVTSYSLSCEYLLKVGLCYHSITPSKTKTNLNYIWISTYHTVSTLPLSYKKQSVNTV